MEVLYFMIPCTFVLAGFGLYWFMWSVKNGQYEDLEGDSFRVMWGDPGEEDFS